MMSAFATTKGSEQPKIAEGRYSELTGRVRHGEPTAVEELSGMLSRGLRLLLSRQLPQQDAEDAVRDTILAVVQGIQNGDLSNPECLMGFVRMVMYRRVAERGRTLAARRNMELDLATSPERASEACHTYDERVLRDEDVAIMREVLSSLSDRDREVVTRFYVDEQSPELIMGAMGLDPTQFRLIVSQAKAQFSARRRLFRSSCARKGRRA